jgi:hypothetical protein
VVGTKVQFEVLENYFAREVNRGSETFVIRGKDGRPIWWEPSNPAWLLL